MDLGADTWQTFRRITLPDDRDRAGRGRACSPSRCRSTRSSSRPSRRARARRRCRSGSSRTTRGRTSCRSSTSRRSSSWCSRSSRSTSPRGSRPIRPPSRARAAGSRTTSARPQPTGHLTPCAAASATAGIRTARRASMTAHAGTSVRARSGPTAPAVESLSEECPVRRSPGAQCPDERLAATYPGRSGRASHRRLWSGARYLLRVVLELEQAARAAEPVGLPSYSNESVGGRRVDLHAADGIDRDGHASPPWLVGTPDWWEYTAPDARHGRSRR